MNRLPWVSFLLLIAVSADFTFASEVMPGDVGYTGQTGSTIYVSELGDNSSGKSWETAFHKIQTALSAVPDGLGGHRVVVRPGHYMEPNLETPHKGAAGAYNLLIGDVDGKLGSGATGWVVVDAGDPEKGFKSWDWWSNMRASTKSWHTGNNKTNFSCIVWDRWALRNLDKVLIVAHIDLGSPCLVGIVLQNISPTKRRRLPRWRVYQEVQRTEVSSMSMRRRFGVT